MKNLQSYSLFESLENPLKTFDVTVDGVSVKFRTGYDMSEDYLQFAIFISQKDIEKLMKIGLWSNTKNFEKDDLVVYSLGCDLPQKYTLNNLLKSKIKFNYKTSYTLIELVKLINKYNNVNPEVKIVNVNKIKKIKEERNKAFDFRKVHEKMEEDFEKQYNTVVVAEFKKRGYDLIPVPRKEADTFPYIFNGLKVEIDFHGNFNILDTNSSNVLEKLSSKYDTIEEFLKDLKKKLPLYLNTKISNASQKIGLFDEDL